MGRAHGFSLVEMLVAIGLTLAVTAAIFTLLNPAEGAFAVEPETADLQQRLRTVTETLSRELALAGAGPDLGASGGSLNHWVASVLPFRRGLSGDDAPGVVRTDTITVLYVPSGGARATLVADLAAGATTAFVEPGTRLAAGMTALVYDANGGCSALAVVSAGAGASSLQIARSAASAVNVFPSGSPVVQVESRTYFLDSDAATGSSRLMVSDGASGADVPVVDHVVGLAFEYFGDPQPPRLLTSGDDAAPQRTTYGPAPPDAGVRTTGYAAGENCVFERDGAGAAQPRLAVLGDGTTLVSLDASRLSDGPWCPDASNENRWDADLLRIRAIGVTVRVESAVDALRGRAGALFSRAGTSTDGRRLVPDREIRFQVSPRNLDLSR